MIEYSVQKVYDEDEFTDIFQIKQNKNNKILLTVGPKEGNFLDTLKSKFKKELLVYRGYLEDEIGVLRSNIGLSSIWTMVLKNKEVAKAEIKGVQYFTITIKDGKKNFSGKTTNLAEIDLRQGRDFSDCVAIKILDNSDKLDLRVKLECKVSPEAILSFAVALDQKFLFDDE